MDSKSKRSKVSPYDDSMWDRSSMYDNMPFHWNPDLNVDKVFNLVSGNLIKSCRCLIIEPYEIKHE